MARRSRTSSENTTKTYRITASVHEKARALVRAGLDAEQAIRHAQDVRLKFDKHRRYCDPRYDKTSIIEASIIRQRSLYALANRHQPKTLLERLTALAERIGWYYTLDEDRIFVQTPTYNITVAANGDFGIAKREKRDDGHSHPPPQIAREIEQSLHNVIRRTILGLPTD